MSARRAALWEPLLRAPFFGALERGILDGRRGIRLNGLVEGSGALVLMLLGARVRRRILVVTVDDAALDGWRRDLVACATLAGRSAERIFTLPALDADPYGGIAPHPEVVRERVIAVDALLAARADTLLVPARALLQPLSPPAAWREWTRVVRRDEELPPERFVLQALGLGYRRVDTVGAPGEVSRRGGIVDIFPMTATEPVRVELFGDAVESLRAFHTDTQRSTGKLDEVTIGPASENPPTEAALRKLAQELRAGIDAARGDTLRHLREQLEVLEQQGAWPGFEALTGLVAASPVSLFEHARDWLVVVDEPERTLEELDRAAAELARSWEEGEQRFLPPPDRLFLHPGVLRRRLADAELRLEQLGVAGGDDEPVLRVACRSARAYSGRLPELIGDLERARAAGTRTVCAMRAPGSTDRLLEIFREFGLEAARIGEPAEALPPGGLFVGTAALRSGFEFQELGLAVLAERTIFGEQRRSAERSGTKRGAFVASFRDLRVGDYVVHVDHGIARYVGLGRPKGGSLNRDFMVLEFAAGDRLFVPVERLDLVQKHSGVAGQKPALDRLGGPGWERLKARVRKSVESMAQELLELYARRGAAARPPSGPDTPWQAELEAAFPYELTPDQERALGEIKRDMMSPRPMDRLLVGDVGFGKTEVGLRAAFKAVMEGRQVAVLAPTTVLALQHHETFSRRFAPFPVRVEMVSRFRSPAEVDRVLADVRAGSVDVLIGTHRLLSQDVAFRNLGLLVVDEEQRFGVAHKERLKKLAIGIDVLSMTATPIPRTLQMSLAGVRDLSVIESPPRGRMAIQTYLVPFKKQVIAQAIRQELRRDGQVFVVHNKIETLHALARAVGEMAPDARIATIHGKLPERALEQAMLRFVHREADVLITTTIVENGLDIPRANTIIVNRADRFGLAQLYQLRGRVGRSDQHAYAYFVIPDAKHLSEVATKRLRALQEFSDLGAGFRLAAADLEIRGAGELLGPRQHGHIAALGFDLYCQMLERAVREASGEAVVEARPVTLNLGVDIKIPETYLPEAGDRLVLYKRLSHARNDGDIDQLAAETEDRYGHLPQAAQNLFALGRLRLLAERCGLKSVDLVEQGLHVRFHDQPPIEPLALVQLIGQAGGTLTPAGIVVLPAPPRGEERIGAVSRLVESMCTAETRSGGSTGGD